MKAHEQHFTSNVSCQKTQIVHFGFKFYIGKSIAKDAFACVEVTMPCKVTFLNLNNHDPCQEDPRKIDGPVAVE